MAGQTRSKTINDSYLPKVKSFCWKIRHFQTQRRYCIPLVRRSVRFQLHIASHKRKSSRQTHRAYYLKIFGLSNYAYVIDHPLRVFGFSNVSKIKWKTIWMTHRLVVFRVNVCFCFCFSETRNTYAFLCNIRTCLYACIIYLSNANQIAGNNAAKQLSMNDPSCIPFVFWKRIKIKNSAMRINCMLHIARITLVFSSRKLIFVFQYTFILFADDVTTIHFVHTIHTPSLIFS